MNAHCFIGVSREVNSLLKASICYREAITALGYSHDNSDSVHYISDT